MGSVCGENKSDAWIGLELFRPAINPAHGESVPDRVILLGLDIKMFHGGPKEAVMHA
jgi:hypothetical protein